MSRRLLVCAWSFIFGMTIFDVCFAHVHRNTMNQWELNAIAFWAMTQFGIGAVVAYKSVAFAALLFALRKAQHLMDLTTCVLVLVHLVLLGMYCL